MVLLGPLTCISRVGSLGKVWLPIFIVSILLLVNISKLKICHDANMKSKSGKIIRIFHCQAGLLQLRGLGGGIR